MRQKIALLLTTALLFVSYFAMLSDGQNTPRSDVEWSEDIKLSEHLGATPDMFCNGENIHAIWIDCPDYFEIHYRRSFDSGISWSRESLLTFGISYAFPKIAVNGNNVHVIWTDIFDNIYYKHSLDGGLTWSDDVALTESDGEFSWQPDIAIGEDVVHVVWKDRRHNDGWGEIYYKRSINNGVDWENETRLTDNYYDSDTPLVGVNGSVVHVVWDDNRDGTYEVWYKKSINNGENWTNDTRITPNDGIDTGSCDLYVDNENLYLVGIHRKRIEGTAYDSIWFMYSNNSGGIWSEPVTLADEYITGGLCSNPSITANDSYVHVAWSDDRTGERQIYYRYSYDKGLHWSDNATLTMPPCSSGTPKLKIDSQNMLHLVWEDKRTGNTEIFYKRSPPFPNITKPEISFIPIISVYANQTINVTANVTSNTTIKYAYLCYRNNTEVPYTIVNMTQTKGSYEFAGKIPPQQNNTTIYYYIWVIDDNNHQNYTDVFNFTVKGKNYPPTIDFWYPLENLTIAENQNITFVIVASDPNNDTLSYEWYLSNSLLQDEIYSFYTFTPDSNSSGNYSVKVVVSDEHYTVNYSWNITVVNIGQLQETINNLQQELNMMIKNNTELTGILNLLNENLTSIWYQLNQSLSNNTELQNQITALNENITSLQNQINQLIQEKENLEDERDEAIKEKRQAERNTLNLGFLLIVALAVCIYLIVLKKKK